MTVSLNSTAPLTSTHNIEVTTFSPDYIVDLNISFEVVTGDGINA